MSFYSKKLNEQNASIEIEKILINVDQIANLIVEIVKQNKIQFILLNGQVGIGKTTLVKQIAKALGENENNISSPSFNKIAPYKKFIHIDAYNMKSNELREYEDYFDNKLVIIEWPKKVMYHFTNYLDINILPSNDPNKRKYNICWRE